MSSPSTNLQASFRNRQVIHDPRHPTIDTLDEVIHTSSEVTPTRRLEVGPLNERLSTESLPVSNSPNYGLSSVSHSITSQRPQEDRQDKRVPLPNVFPIAARGSNNLPAAPPRVSAAVSLRHTERKLFMFTYIFLFILTL